jgi:hypothetical protein
MAGVSCGEYIFGTDSGIVNKQYTKEVRRRNVGHYESGGRFVLDCSLVESSEVTHTITTYGESPAVPDQILEGSVTFYLAEVAVQASKEAMWQWTWTYKEQITTNQCSIVVPELTFTPALCAWGLKGGGTIYPSNMSFRKRIELQTVNGPTGLDGSDENNPISGLALSIPTKVVETLQFTTEVEYSSPVNVTIESALGSGSVYLTGNRKYLTSVQHTAPHNDINTWSYTVESQTEVS